MQNRFTLGGDHAVSLGALSAQYPRTVSAFTAMGALDHLERVAQLDSVWAAIRGADSVVFPREQIVPAYQCVPHHPPRVDDWYDLIYAGGGLGLLHAAVMAVRYGYRVLLFDQGEVGCVHREWNISRAELAALVALGFCSWDDLRDVVMNEYHYGVVRFFAQPGVSATELRLQGVLDVALDAGALLRLARRVLVAAGGVVLDRRGFRQVCVNEHGPMQVDVAVVCGDGAIEHYRGRLLVDGMGSGSPLVLHRFGGRPFAGVCPTVGTVATGYSVGAAPDSHTPHVGDILISVAHAQGGEQYLWEGFPGRDDELTVYLFYYDTLVRRRSRAVSSLPRAAPALLQLFEDYFTLLPTYKRPGPHFQHRKPVYGYIPARHSLRRQEAPLLRGVVPIGDSSAHQSPLTFCGFGSHVRNLGRTTALLDHALRRGLTEARHLHAVSAYQVNVSLHWVFSRFMQPWQSPADVNVLQNVFLGVLHDAGDGLAERFFLDQMRWGDYHRMILGMFWRFPRVVLIAWRVLGFTGVVQWIADYLMFSVCAVGALIGRGLGGCGQECCARLLGCVSPAGELRLRAQFAEWRAMGW